MPLAKKRDATRDQLVKSNYTSGPVDIPRDFLLTKPHDASAISLSRVNFANSPLPEYVDCTALILDNVLSESECTTLVCLAEKSAEASGLWRPAMINMGLDHELLRTDYRNSDRIIWDSEEVTNRVWQRCLQAEGFGEVLNRVEGNASILGPRPVERGESWRFTRLNERMRFLRYGKGQFFQAHCDASYVNPHAEGTERSLLTLQLYLNSDKDLVGGATSFHSNKRLPGQVDVLPEPGRVLIFQHRGLLHSGQEVSAGVKFTMRTDLMYELLKEKADPGKAEQ